MKQFEDGHRFEDPRQTIHDLMDEILVVCPRCQSCARIIPIEPEKRGLFAPRRLVCIHCAYTRDWAEKRIRRRWLDKPVSDDFFGVPLWLQESVRGKVLWAYNLQHLNLIEAYVSAELREHRRDSETGWSNRSLVNRLPLWVKASKNRAAVLKAVQRLRTKYQD